MDSDSSSKGFATHAESQFCYQEAGRIAFGRTTNRAYNTSRGGYLTYDQGWPKHHGLTEDGFGTSSRGVEGGQGGRSPGRPNNSPDGQQGARLVHSCSLLAPDSCGLVGAHPKLRRMEGCTEKRGRHRSSPLLRTVTLQQGSLYSVDNFSETRGTWKT